MLKHLIFSEKLVIIYIEVKEITSNLTQAKQNFSGNKKMLAVALFIIYYTILVHLFAPTPYKTVKVASPQQPVNQPSQIDRASMKVIFDIYDEQQKEEVKLDSQIRTMTVKQLKRLARARKIKGYSKLRKEELISAILSS